jgi:hypothetical protein
MRTLLLLLFLPYLCQSQVGSPTFIRDFDSVETPFQVKGNYTFSRGLWLPHTGTSWQADTGSEGTLWWRFQVPSQSDGQVQLYQNDDVAVLLKLKDNRVFLNFESGGQKSLPHPTVSWPAGLWVQTAITREEIQPKQYKYKLYFYPEYSSPTNADAKRNFWVYFGSITSPSSQGKSGNGTLKWKIDELRTFSQKLELRDLYDVFPKGPIPFPKEVPGVVIEHSPAFTGRFVAGSPAIIILDDGTYLVKGDHYGPAVGDSELVVLFQSKDKGKTWTKIAEVEGMTWASLFKVKNALYMLGTSAGHKKGHAIIMRSLDQGKTWTRPTDSENGLIYADLSYHTAPTPVVIHDGRVWKAMEDEKGPGGWGTMFRAFLMSASVNSDLLKAESWTRSEILPSQQTWANGTFRGWLEGNAVLGKDGHMKNILRLSIQGGGGKAAIISYNKSGTKAHFDPEKDIIDFPGGSTKFHIHYDEPSKKYWALANAVPEKHSGEAYSESLIRNTLVLMSSKELREWKVEKTVLYHPETAVHAFQYPTFTIEGDDLIFVSRTAYDDAFGGAYKHHDVNFFTFHRIENFRK